MKKNFQSRRGFLGLASALSLGRGASIRLLAQDAEDAIPVGGGSAKRVIWLTMRGGMSQFETFCPTEGASHPGSPVMIDSAIPGHQVSEWLPKMASRLNRCTVIRSMSSVGFGHAEKGEYVMRTGYSPRTLLTHACLGSWVSWHRLQQERPTWNFRIGGDAEQNEAFLGPRHAPMTLRYPDQGAAAQVGFRIPVEEVNARQAVWKELNASFGSRERTGEYATGFSLMRKGVEDIVDVTKANPAEQMRYGMHSFGRGCLIARRLAVADLSAFTEVILDGWDAPAPYFPQVRTVTEMLDKALSSLITDLESEGILEETLVVLATPVGRTPSLLGGRRNDYPRVACAVMAGGGVKGGRVFGSTDEVGKMVREGAVSPQDLNTTVAWALGIDYREAAFSRSGRPFTVRADQKARPVTELFRA